jgi:nitrite reductase/ring-hydroxylating ferredoxin subunit
MDNVDTPSVMASTPAMSSVAGWTLVGPLQQLRERGCTVVSGGPAVAVFCSGEEVYAVDNRCPHMGFPLSKGTVQGGILTCHWHHARFDLQSGGTFDPFADDVQVYPTRVVDGQVWANLQPQPGDRAAHWKGRLQDGLEQNIPLVLAKAVLALLRGGTPAHDLLAIAGAFGARYRRQGWGPGLTILTAMANVVPSLGPDDQVLALYHGMVHLADEVDGQAPRFPLDPLPTAAVPPARLKAWFRRFVEVRDAEGAERTLLTAIASGMSAEAVADMLLTAATDHYFLAGGHTLDFINKAFEYLELVGWSEAATILPSLIPGLAAAQRSEELNAWRHPVDLVALLEPICARLPELLGTGVAHAPSVDAFADLSSILLADDPEATVTALTSALKDGWSFADMGSVLAYSAALRVARFHTSNEFSDWITVLHTFTYCNALYRHLLRAPSAELARGIFHGAMGLYLDRFLNMPAARLPDAHSGDGLPAAANDLLASLTELLDREQQVNAAGIVVAHYLSQGHAAEPLLANLGGLLLREDGEFHSYQMLEAGIRTYQALCETRPVEARHTLVAVARYLAAHAPTSRAMLQTARTAMRLARGVALWEEDEQT